MAAHTTITLPTSGAPLENIENVQVWLSEIGAIVTLACDDIAGTGPGIIALGVVEAMVEKASEELGVAMRALWAAGIRHRPACN